MRHDIAAEILGLLRVALLALAEPNEDDALVAAVARADEIEPIAAAPLEPAILERSADRAAGAPVHLRGSCGQGLVFQNADDDSPALGDGVFGELDFHTVAPGRGCAAAIL